MDDRDYEEISFDVEPGDLIVLYSDGISEQPNPQDEEFDKRRIGRAMKRSYTKSAEEVADGILADLDIFSNGAPVHDDQTLIVLKVQ